MTWNINGWKDNCEIRTKVITGECPHICTLVETHLRDDESVNVYGYKTFSHNRIIRNRKAKRNFGGLCILVKESLSIRYNINIYDKSFDGILVLKLQDKVSNYSFAIIAGYLPPEGSPYGRDATAFFNHILNIVHELCDLDCLYFTGDFNSRIGKEKDFVEGIDDIIERCPIDKEVNSHGKAFLEFLTAAKMCVCNGRFGKSNDNWTCVKWNGTSVVDYYVVPINDFSTCHNFEIKTCRECINNHCINDGNEVILNTALPDHSVLLLTINVSFYVNEIIPNESSNITQIEICHKPCKFLVDKVPMQFLASTEARQELTQMIECIETVRDEQCAIDNVYDKLCTMFYHEMSVWYRKKMPQGKSMKKLYRQSCPFWNSDLKNLWNIACDKEKIYLKETGVHRQQTKHEYNLARKQFDKTFRREKRRYQRNKVNEIEKLNTDDPKEFWKTLKNLGPRKKQQIPIEVYNEQGEVTTDPIQVLEKWKNDFHKLYSPNLDEDGTDTDIQDDITAELRNANVPTLYEMQNDIETCEIERVVNKAKLQKSTGEDDIPYEIFKNGNTNELLKVLFNKIYTTGKMPAQWNLAIIKPIPKSGSSDPRIPMQYRGISLLPVIYKMYSSVINNRLKYLCEANNLFATEQNGFRAKRSCSDHLYTLTSIIRNRINRKNCTFVAFVDLQKAFDSVNRDLLILKLKRLGLGGKLLSAIQCVYSNPIAKVSVNELKSDAFKLDSGVKQGDPLSPTLFGLFINDLVSDINELNMGIDISNDIVLSVLLYADDLAILTDSSDKLQNMINVLYNWCEKWQMKVNVKKTKIVHFRHKGLRETDKLFKYGNETIEVVDKYKYLGLVLDEYLNYNVTSNVLSESAGRALGSIQNKVYHLKGLDFKSYCKLFNVGVVPIMNYGAGIWGFKDYSKAENVQNRAIRFYLGVNNYSPKHAFKGDVGWVDDRVRRQIEMLRYWNRIVNMDNSRIEKKVFMMDKTICNKNWCAEIFSILSNLRLIDVFHNNSLVNIKDAERQLMELYKDNWEHQIQIIPKLRTYVQFKEQYECESYVYKVKERAHLSILAQFRFGILPLAVETGRYNDIPIEYRLCEFCSYNVLEDETHFMFYCSFYDDLRSILLLKIIEKCPEFYFLSLEEKYKLLMSNDFVKYTAQFLFDSYQRRRNKKYMLL